MKNKRALKLGGLALALASAIAFSPGRVEAQQTQARINHAPNQILVDPAMEQYVYTSNETEVNPRVVERAKYVKNHAQEIWHAEGLRVDGSPPPLVHQFSLSGSRGLYVFAYIDASKNMYGYPSGPNSVFDKEDFLFEAVVDVNGQIIMSLKDFGLNRSIDVCNPSEVESRIVSSEQESPCQESYDRGNTMLDNLIRQEKQRSYVHHP